MTLTSANFDSEVKKFQGVALVDFWATWCGPCLMQAPILDELMKEYESNPSVKIGKLDTDENQDIASRYNIMSIPNLKFFKNGQLVAELVGLSDKERIKEKIEEVLARKE
jgi:thioredoxin 1